MTPEHAFTLAVAIINLGTAALKFAFPNSSRKNLQFLI
jgi:hypothetical protein